MSTPNDKLRLTVIQIRPEPGPELHEQTCLLDYCRVAREQIRFVNIARSGRVDWRDVESAHAVFLGGSGEYSVLENHTFMDSLGEVMTRLIDDGRPVLGSCWGQQFLAVIGGGSVIRDHDLSEIGSRPVHLTDEGAADPLFKGFPRTFNAQLGHHDRVDHLGGRLVELAASDLCPNQAIRIKDRPVYGTQFHSELNATSLRERLEFYREDYAPQESEFNAVVDGLRPSPEADRIIPRFLELYA